MNKFSRDLLQEMQEAVAIAEGQKTAPRVHTVEVPDARAAAYLQAIARQPKVIEDALQRG